MPSRVALIAVLLAGVVAAEPPRDWQGEPLPEGAVARLGSARFRHDGLVRSLAFAPDGKTLASVGDDGAACLWEVATGRLVRRWPAHTEKACHVAYAPDGSGLVTADDPGELAVWSPDGRLRFRGPSHDALPAYSADGRRLAVYTNPRHVAVLDAVTGKEERSFTAHRAAKLMALSPDGKRVALADSTVHLYDAVTGKLLRTYQPDEASTTALAFTPDGKGLLTGTARGLLCLWETDSEEAVWKYSENTGTIVSLAIDPGGREATALTGAGVVLRLDLKAGTATASGEATRNEACYPALGPGGKRVARAEGSRIRLDDPEKKAETPVPGRQPSFGETAWSPDGKTVAVATLAGDLFLWEPLGRAAPRRLDAPRRAAFAVSFSPDGRYVALGGQDHACVRVEVATGTLGPVLRPAPGTPVAFAPAGSGLLVAGTGTHALLDPATGKERWSLEGLGRLTPGFTTDGRSLAALTDGKVLRLWEVATGRERHRVELEEADPEKVHDFAVAPDGSRVAVSEGTGAVHLHDAETGRLLRRMRVPGEEPALAFSPGGRVLAAGGLATVVLWDAATGDELCRLGGHPEGVRGVTFSPDGKYLLTAGHDGTALVWDVAACLARAARPAAGPRALADLWADLAVPDGVRGFAAVRELAARPDEAVPFLKRHLLPVPRPDPARLTRLVADLDSDQFETRAQAARELRALDRLAEPALRRALAGQPTPQARRQIAELLSELEELPVGEALRALRAIEALERSRPPEAQRLLEALAEGAPGARPTEAARAAVERLKRRAAPAR